MYLVQVVLQLLAGALLIGEIHQQQVIIGAAGHQLHAPGQQLLGHGLSVFDDLSAVLLELGLQCLAEAHSLCGDHVLQRAALGAREDGLVDLLGNLLAVGEDQTAPGAAQGLMGGGSHHIGIGHRALMIACCHQTGDVGHIHHQQRAVVMGNLSDPLEVNGTGIGRSTGHHQLRLYLGHLLGHLVIVDEALVVDAVGNEVIVLAGHIHGAAVGQMTALAQIHAHHRVAQIQQAKVNGHIRLSTAVGLYIGIGCTKELLCPVDGDLLHLIDVHAAAVVALSGIALGILVGEDAAHGRHDGRRYNVLAGNELNVLALAVQLPIHGSAQLGIYRGHCADGIYHVFIHRNRAPFPLNRRNRSGKKGKISTNYQVW